MSTGTLDNIPNRKQAAMAYAGAGLRVIGLHGIDERGLCSCGKVCKSPAKHPRPDLSPHGAREPYVPPEVIETWSGCFNIGIGLGVLGTTNIYVLDVDDPAVAALLQQAGIARETACSTTGRGLHVWMGSDTSVANFNPRRADTGKPIGEFRGEGLYVVAPPSDHITGRAYAWLGETPAGKAMPKIKKVAEPVAFVSDCLARVGIDLSTRQASPVPPWEGTTILECALPDPIARSGWGPMADVNFILRGAASARGISDRSGQLWWLAKTIQRAATLHKTTITVEQLAGVLKRADRLCFACYVGRADADRQYGNLASKALSTP
jgi:hypothetical protein